MLLRLEAIFPFCCIKSNVYAKGNTSKEINKISAQTHECMFLNHNMLWRTTKYCGSGDCRANISDWGARCSIC